MYGLRLEILATRGPKVSYHFDQYSQSSVLVLKDPNKILMIPLPEISSCTMTVKLCAVVTSLLKHDNI